MIEVMYVLIAGLIIAAMGYFAIGIPKKMKSPALLLGIVLVGAALFYPGYGYYGDMFETPEETPVATVGAVATFDITLTNGSCVSVGATTQASNMPGTVSADGKTITYQVFYDSGTNSYDGSGVDASALRDSGATNFSIRPIAPVGADNTQLVTIAYNFNEEAKYSSEDVFDESADEKMVEWRIDSARTEGDSTGQYTMLYTDTDSLELRWQLAHGNNTLGDDFTTVGESMSLPVTFSNNYGWSETFTLTWVIIGTDT